MNFPYGASPYPLPGEVIEGKYEVIRTLGVGGMGAVLMATHRLLRSPVALKFIAPYALVAPGAVERFINEAHAARRIQSAHVVDIFDIGQLPSGAPYIVMEYLDGRDLAALFATDGSPGLPVGRAVHFALQILRALDAAHEAGIIHRDMKPSNCVIVRHDGEDDFVKVVDFGISKVEHEGAAALTKTNSALGTPLYMSPEQAKSARSVDARTDLYSTAAILYEALAGRTPHVSDSGELSEILFKLFTAEAPPLLSFRPDVPVGLAAVVHRALHRDRDVRPATATEMAELLAPFADERSAGLVARFRPHAAPRLERTVPLPSIPPGSQPVAHSASIPPPSSLSPSSRPVVVDDSRGNDATHLAGGSLGHRAEAASSGSRTDMGASREQQPRSTPTAGRRGLLWILGPAVLVLAVVVTLGVMLSRRQRDNDIHATDTGPSAREVKADAPRSAAPSASAVVPTTADSTTASPPSAPSVVASAAPSASASPRPPTHRPTPSAPRMHQLTPAN